MILVEAKETRQEAALAELNPTQLNLPRHKKRLVDHIMKNVFHADVANVVLLHCLFFKRCKCCPV